MNEKMQLKTKLILDILFGKNHKSVEASSRISRTLVVHGTDQTNENIDRLKLKQSSFSFICLSNFKR